MYPAQITHPIKRPVRLMWPRSAKRWGQWFAYAWLIMWVSTALLPCCEVAAAVATHEQVAHSDCEHPGDAPPDSKGGKKHTPCFSISAPASAERPAASGAGNLAQQVLGAFVFFHIVPPEPALSRPVDHLAAPPPVAVYLRSLRLLI